MIIKPSRMLSDEGRLILLLRGCCLNCKQGVADDCLSQVRGDVKREVSNQELTPRNPGFTLLPKDSQVNRRIVRQTSVCRVIPSATIDKRKFVGQWSW